MEDCIFCKIANKEVSAYIVYEDDNFMAFLDLNPQSPGHCQVIPKTHYRWVWDVPSIGEYFKVVRMIALAQRKAFDIDWILSKIVGEEMPHAHIWVYPAKAGEDPENFKSNAEKIRKELN